jgi:hypothetical protein
MIRYNIDKHRFKMNSKNFKFERWLSREENPEIRVVNSTVLSQQLNTLHVSLL